MLENTALNSSQENVANKKKKKEKKINDDEYKNFWFLFNVVPCSTVISREEIRLIRIKDFLEVEWRDSNQSRYMKSIRILWRDKVGGRFRW